jgi:hypothetical protein
MALQHVISGRRIIVAQRDHIERLRARGGDATDAEQLLSQYERTQAELAACFPVLSLS